MAEHTLNCPVTANYDQQVGTSGYEGVNRFVNFQGIRDFPTRCTGYRGKHSSHDILALANASAEGIEKKPDFGCSGTEPIY
jgi:hypothetical protein